MPGFALLMLQVAVAAPPAPDERLLHIIPQHRCTGSSTEIVVCAQQKQDAYRLPNTGPQVDEPALPKAEWRLFGDTKMGVNAAQRSLPGASAPAAMVTVTVPF